MVIAKFRGEPLPRAHRLKLDDAGSTSLVTVVRSPGVVVTLCGQVGRLVELVEPGTVVRPCSRCEVVYERRQRETGKRKDAVNER